MAILTPTSPPNTLPGYPANNPFAQKLASSGLQELGFSTGMNALPPLPPPTLVGQYKSTNGYPLLHFKLGNGHQVFIEQRPSDAVSLRTFIRAGSINERPVYTGSNLYAKTGAPAGGAHFDEHCHFLSTEHMPGRNQWTAVVEGYGAKLNASTDYESIQHELLFNREALPDLLKLHAEALLHPAYNPNLIFQEKRNVINEASERMADPEAEAYSRLMEMLLDRPHFQSLGNRSDVLNTTAEDLRQFYEQTYTPANMLTVLSGNVNPLEVLPLLNETFGRNPNRNSGRNPANGLADAPMQLGLQVALQPNEKRWMTYTDPALPSSMAYLAFPAPPVNDDATETLRTQGLAKTIYTSPADIPMVERDRMAFLLLQTLLTDGMNALLPVALTEKLKLADDVALEYIPFRRAGMAVLGLQTRPGQEQQAVNATLNLLGQLGQKPVATGLLEEAKQRLIQEQKQAQEQGEVTTELVGSAGLNNALPFYLNFEAIAASITPEDLTRVAKQYLSPNRYALLYAQPAEQKGFSPKISSTQGVLPFFLPEGTLPSGGGAAASLNSQASSQAVGGVYQPLPASAYNTPKALEAWA